jgi:hypothetical protein
VGDDRWGRAISGRERTDSGSSPEWAVGCFGGWADLVPLASFLFSDFFFIFYFDFSDLFHIFCKFDSNQIKQFPKMFYCSLQCFKIVINQVFKIKYVFPIKLYVHGIKFLLA